MDLQNEGRTERGREERGRVSSMRITFHLVENLFLDGTMPGRINLSEFSESWSRSAATKRISSTRPPSGFPFLGLSFRRAFRRFSTRSGFDDGGQNFRRKRGNDDFHDGKEGNVPRVYPSSPTEKALSSVDRILSFKITL